ncbi:MAG: FapA family protein [Lachnospiraceae bacterium]|nr:FapA family protein [Lachnospiraceae bacterium]
MNQENGYIQVEYRDDNEAFVLYYPPTGSGEKPAYKECAEYLKSKGFENFNNQELRQLLTGNDKGEMSLGVGDGIEFSESLNYTISLDKMKVVCRFYPPSKNGNVLNVQDILGELAKKNVKYGINQELILEFMNNRVYFTDMVIAEGVNPVHGIDDKIEYFFNTNPSLKPKHNEDGSVDYHDLGNICQVKEGDLLARLHKGDKGSNGKDVTGKDIPCRTIKTLRLEPGKNMTMNEDMTELYSDVTGHVSLVNDKVFVSDVYEVPGDVDNSVGNIEYNGNVHIQGSVRGGFQVIAKGDIVIDGVVEDALIQSDEGQIIVKCGIHGMKKGLLDAGGNIVTKFIENASVFSGGYVEAGTITQSDVSASDDIIVSEKKGVITGGVIRAGGMVDAQTIGNTMGTVTKIEVGMAPDKKERYVQLQREITVISQNINKLKPIIKTYNKYITEGKQLDQKNAMYLQKLAGELTKNTKLLEENQNEFNELHHELITSRHAKIKVNKDVYPGVSITISDVSFQVKDKRSFCQFEKKDGEVYVTNL